MRVFQTFLKIRSNDFAYFAYLDSTNHYLQLFYWSHVPESYGFQVKLRQSLNFSIDTKVRKGHLLVISGHFGSFWGGQKLSGHGFRPFSRVWRLRIDWNCIERLGSNLYSDFRQIWGVLRGSSSPQGVSRDPWGPKISKNSKNSKFSKKKKSNWVILSRKKTIEVGHPGDLEKISKFSKFSKFQNFDFLILNFKILKSLTCLTSWKVWPVWQLEKFELFDFLKSLTCLTTF